MKTPATFDHDVIVVGAGISGLGAALKLKEAGLNVLVLEKNEQTGGRMSTDRIGDYVIDRGATIFGGRFHRMKALVKKLKLEHLAEEINFTFGLQDKSKFTKIRRGRLDDVLFNPKIGFRGKLALIRFGISVLLRGRKLGHGNTTGALNLDDLSVEDYFRKIGGSEVLDHFLNPGLNGPMGGHLRKNSRLILFQTFWNIMLMKTLAIKGGMDNIINAMCKEVEVRTNAAVEKIEIVNESAHVFVNGKTLTAKSVIIALPGNVAAKLCTQLPAHVLRLLHDTKYGQMVSAHVMLNKPTDTTCAAYGISQEIARGYEIELEHNRVSQLCADGKGLASIYMWNEPGYFVTEKSDDEVKTYAEEIIRKHFPECANEITDTHVLRWKDGIAHFPPGRLTQMSALREEMKTWKLPVQLCGDYLDGIASESALVTGEEAAENILKHY
ncbi:MAG TPA: NAD(P)/FAD-dependent oxidoreductase [Bacteroidia bacterium]|nr:NAD(P)/FAD-dependent oxidoreductase [Bacteroidia bacterium]